MMGRTGLSIFRPLYKKSLLPKKNRRELRDPKLGSPLLLTLFLMLLLFLIPSLSVVAQESYLHHRLQGTILTGDPEKGVEEIVAWVESQGGYFIRKASDTVIARVPAEKADGLRRFLESISEDVVEYIPEAYNLREEYLATQSGIESRQEIFDKNLEYLGKTDVEGTLAVEKEIMRLLTEIEGLKGRLRRITADIRYALVTVHLHFQQQSLPENIASSFEWINRVDFYSFIKDQYYGD